MYPKWGIQSQNTRKFIKTLFTRELVYIIIFIDMIKLAPIAKTFIKEGGKLFGSRAVRVTTAEMNSVFEEVKEKLGKYFSKMQLSRALKSKPDHGDIDIVVEPNPHANLDLKNQLSGAIDYSKNGNIHSVLYHSDKIGKDVHIDFLIASGEDYDPQYEYLSFNDFSGILGVLARRLGYSYSIEGFFKVYVDKSDRHHKILITKNLRDGLKILGYSGVLHTYDDIGNPDDIIKFISSSPYFDSQDYVGQTMNHSDRKRVRAGRPTADYIRQHLIMLNKRRENDDFEYYLKTSYPDKYAKLKQDETDIENKAMPPKAKYGGDWLLQKFPQLKAGPTVGKVLKFWHDTYGQNLDNVPEQELLVATKEFLGK